MKFLAQALPLENKLLLLFQRWVIQFLFSAVTVASDNVQPKSSFKDFIDSSLMEHKTGGDDESNDSELLDTNDELKRKRASSEPEIPPASLNSASKSRQTSVYQTAAETTKKGMQELGDRMNMAMAASQLPSTTRFDQCLPILSLMRKEGSLTKEDYLQYCRFLMQNEKHAAMFIGMDEDLRMEWLEMEYLESSIK